MTPKELQEQYLADLKPRMEEIKQAVELPNGYINHVRNQAFTLARMIGRDNGIHYIKEALRDWPKEMEEELKSLEVSLGFL